MQKLTFPLVFIASCLQAQVQNSASATPDELGRNHPRLLKWEKFSLRGYGAVNYYKFGNYDTDTSIKDKFDPERLNLYLEYKFDENLSFKSEIEFEHGGTGTSLELDNQEEFGEIEHEIGKGGEVKVEQININYKFSDALNIRAGRLKVYFNTAQNLDYPTSYFTTHRQEMENTILPLGWYENGIEFHGIIAKKWRYYLTMTNGMDSSGFSSAAFIKGGYQQKFEMQNTNAFGYMGRLDYFFGSNKYTFAGVSTYLNNTTPNRIKKDTDYDAWLNLISAHINYNEGALRFSGVGMYGHLQNADKITQSNTRLSNTFGVKRTPVGSSMLGISFEAGYEIMHLFHPSSHFRLYPFARIDHYDTMFNTSGSVVKKERWQRTSWTAGLNFFVHPQIVLKAQYSRRVLGSHNMDIVTTLPTGGRQMENYFSAGLAFTLD